MLSWPVCYALFVYCKLPTQIHFVVIPIISISIWQRETKRDEFWQRMLGFRKSSLWFLTTTRFPIYRVVLNFVDYTFGLEGIFLGNW